MSDAQETASVFVVRDDGGIANWIRDQMQLLIDRSVSSPLGFATALVMLIFAGSIGFLIGVFSDALVDVQA